jgi:ATP-dependent Zn protease
VFGLDASSTGSYGDIKQATEAAAQFVRHYGFSTRLSHTDVTNDSDDNLNTDVMPTNQLIETILQEQLERASNIVREESELLMQIIKELMQNGSIAPDRMAQLTGAKLPQEEVLLECYADLLKVFALQLPLQGKELPVCEPQERCYIADQ